MGHVTACHALSDELDTQQDFSSFHYYAGVLYITVNHKGNGLALLQHREFGSCNQACLDNHQPL